MRLFSESGPKDRSTRYKRAIFLAVAICSVLAGIFAYSGITQLAQQHTLQSVTEVRDQAIQLIEQALSERKSQFQQVLSKPEVQHDLAADDRSKIEDAIRQGMTDVMRVIVIGEDLGKVYDNIQTFGYGRLGLIEAASASNTLLITIVNEEKSVRIGMAAPVHLGQGDGSVYVSLPINILKAKFATLAVPSRGYLALRQGEYTLFESGQTLLRESAEALSRPLEEPALRVVAGAPPIAMGPLGCGVIACLLWTGLFVTGAFVLLGFIYDFKGIFSRFEGKNTTDNVADELTLSTSLQGNSSESVKIAEFDADSSTSEIAETDPSAVTRCLFHESGIHGLVGKDLTPGVSLWIGRALGTYLLQRQKKGVVVGYDGRKHGTELKAGLIQGLRSAGIDVTDLGIVTTPMAQFAAQQLDLNCSINVTGSHLAAEYNGFSVRIDHQVLADDVLLAVYQLIQEKRLHVAETSGSLNRKDFLNPYLLQMTDSIQMSRSLKVVVDCGNGAASDIAPRVLSAIGAEVVLNHCELGQPFPHRGPNPFYSELIQDVLAKVENEQADLGFIIDGDANCLSVIIPGQGLLRSDRVLMLFISDVLQRHPGSVIMYDLFSSQALTGFILQHGGRPLMWLPNAAKCLEKMHQSNAQLAGCSHGHYFFCEHLQGGDDALYAASRLLEILAQREKSIAETCAILSDNTQSAHYTLPIETDEKPEYFIKKLIIMSQDGALGVGPFASTRVSTIDGIRIDFYDGWLLLRESMAEPKKPKLELRLEALDKDAFERIQTIARDVLVQILPADSPLPF